MAAIVSSDALGLATSSIATLGPRATSGNALQGRGTERVYVNLASGNLVLQDADERLVGSGLTVEGVRTYNSQGRFDGAYTPGPYNVSGLQPPHLEFTGKLLRPGTTVTRVDQDGGVTYYDFDTARGLYLCTDGAGAYDTIAYDGNNLTWTDGDTGVTERYADGKPHNWALAERRDPDGNTLRFSYNRWGQVERIVTASGESTLFDYSAGLLTQVRNVTRDGPAAGTVRVRYAYDNFDRLTSASVDLSPADNRISDGRAYITRYAYEGVSDRVSAVMQDDGSINRFTYVHLLGDYRIASVTDALGQITRFDYNLGTRRTTVTDPLGLVTRYDYDGAGQLLRITGPAVQSGAQVQSFLYNSRGDVTQVTDARGLVTAMEYDRNGNLVLQRDAAGNTIARSYGARNQLLTETVFAMPDPDGAGSGRASQPQTSHSVYDSRLNLRFVVSAEGRVTEYRYNATGQRTAELHHAAALHDSAGWTVAYPQPLPSNSGVSVGGYTGAAPTEAMLAAWVARQAPGQAVRTDYGYDFRGQLAQQTRYATLRTDGSGTPEGSAVSRFIYDANGRLLQTVEATGGVTRTAYDGLNRLLATFDALGNSTLVRYDDAGNRTLTTQANGLQGIDHYDRAGRLVGQLQVDTAGTVLGSTRHDYDADGRLRRSTDATGVQRWMLYDAAGRLTGEIDGDGSLAEYVYNADDVLLQTVRHANRIDARPALTGPYIDELPRLRPASRGDDVRTWQVVDSANRLVAQVDGAGTVTRIDYDGASRVLRTVVYATQIDTGKLTSAPTLAQVLPATSTDDRITRRFHDQDGLLRGELDAAGMLRETRYDAAGQAVMRVAYARPTDVALRAGATLAQLLPAASKDDIVEHRVYDARGLLVAEIDGEGYLTSYRYDGNGNRTETVRHAQALTSSQRAALVAGGIGAALPQIASLADQRQQFGYDLLNRLVTRTDTAGTVTRNEYDSMGRLVASTTAAGTSESRTQTRRYDLQGRLVAELSGEGSAALAAPGASVASVWQTYATSYTYDAAGRMTSRTDANNHRTLFFYNADSQMIYAINALGEVEAHRHDGLRQETGIIRHAVRLDSTTLATLQGGLTNASIDAGIAALASGNDNATTFVYDRAGRQINRTDALGIHTRQRYNSFGDAIATTDYTETGPIETRRRFDARGLLTGETRDAAGSAAIAAITRQEYDAFGRIVGSTDALGNTRTTQYDRLGRTVQVVDATGATQGTAYDAFSRIIIRTDALGNATTLRYDDQARSSTLTTAEGITVTTVMNRHGQTQSVTDGNGNIVEFGYDRDGNQVAQDTALAHTERQYDRTGLLIDTVDGNGTSTTLRYDAANRVLSRTVDPAGLALTTSYVYDALGRIVQNTDRNGTVTTFGYNRAGQLLQQVIDPDGLALTTRFTWDARGQQLSVTDADGTLTRYQYDGLGRRIAQIIDANGLALTTRYSYDANGNLLASTDATGHTSRYAYDAENRLRYSVDGAGDVTAMAYDAAGRIIQSTHYAQAISIDGLASNIASIAERVTTSATDITEHRVLDRDGRLAWTVDGRGGVNAYRHDGNGNVIERRAYATAIDLAAWQRGTTPPVTTDDAHDLRQRTLYDAANRAIATLDGAGGLALQRHDANGNLVERTRYAVLLPAGTPFAGQTVQPLAERMQSMGASGSTTRTTYDRANRLLATFDALGNSTLVRYDDAGNRMLTTQANGLQDIDQYDRAGRLVARMQVDTAGTVLGTTRHDYDADGRLRRSTDATGVQRWMLYDAAGRLTGEIDGDGSLTEYVYNADDVLLQTVRYGNRIDARPALSGPYIDELRRLRPPASGDDVRTWRVVDSANRLVAQVDGAGTVTRVDYDGASRVLRTVVHATAIDTGKLTSAPTLAQVLPASSPDDRVTRRFYDQDGLLRAELDAAGTLREIRYDAAGQPIMRIACANPTNSVLRAGATLAQLLPAASKDDIVEHMIYDARGLLVAEIDGEGYLTSDRYDGNGNRTETVRHAQALTSSQRAVLVGGGVSAALPQIASLADQQQQFGYDLLNRLVTRMDTAGTVTRNEYDSMGRLVASTTAAGTSESRTQTRRYDLQGRLVAELSGEGSAALAAPGASVAAVWQDYATSYTYDAAGRMTSRIDANNHRTLFFYNADSQLVYAIDALGEVEAHRYDGLSQETGITRYATRLDVATLATLQGGLASAQIDAVVAALANASTDATTTLIYDRAGRQINRTDALGIHTRQRYDSFGDALATTVYTEAGPIETRRRFDARGLLLSETQDATGQTAIAAPRQEHDAFGRVVSSTDALGNTRITQYDRLGRTVQVVDAMGGAQSAAYDAYSRVIIRIDALGNATTLRYDDQARSSTLTTAEGIAVTTVMNRHGQTQSITDGNGNVATFSYDRDGNPVAQDTALAHTERHHDRTGLLIDTVDSNGTSTALRYDAANRLLSRTVDPAGLALTTTYGYDALGRIVRSTDPNGTVTTFGYDRAGQLLEQVIDPDGLALTTRFTWDARGQQLSVTDANGILTSYQYNGLGRRIAQIVDVNGLALTTRYSYDANGNLLASTDAAGHTSRYAYDAGNRMRYTVDGAGDVTALSYDAASRLIQTTRYAQAISTDGLASDITVIAARVTASPTDQTEHRVLDRDGRLAWTVDGRGAVNAYRYDGNNNVIEHRAYATAIDLAAWQRSSAPPVTADDAHDLRQRTLYDAANRAIATLDGAGGLALQRHDANGNLLERTRYAAFVPTDASFTHGSLHTLAERIADSATDASDRYTHDAANRQLTHVDGAGALTRFTHDSNGNLLRTLAYASALPPGASPGQAQPSDADRVTDNIYDAANRLAWQVDALGGMTHQTFDGNGNLLVRTAYAHAPAALASAQRALPDAAALHAMRMPDAQQDRVLRYAHDGANRLVYTIDAEGAATRTVHDALGQPLTVTRHAQLLSLADLQALDATAVPRAAFFALLLQADPQHDRTIRQIYDAAGRVVAAIDAEGYVTQRRHDALGRLLQLDSCARALPPAAAPASTADLQASLTPHSADRSEQWTWDTAGHLAQHIDALGQAESWQTDALGNRIAWRNAAGALWQYAYDAAGRMTAEIAPAVMVADVVHDSSGNLVLDGQPALQHLVTRLRYNALGNLRARTEAAGRPDECTTFYEYDALGRQVRTLFPPVGIYTAALDDPLHNGIDGLAQRTESLHTLFSQTRYDSFGDAISGRDVAGNTSRKTYDRLGRVVHDIDAAGYVTAYRRNGFGDVVALTRHALAVALLSTGGIGIDSATVDAALTRSNADRSLQQTVDRNGRLTRVSEADVTVYDPDAAPGAQLFTADATTRNRYNAFGDQVESAQLKVPLADRWTSTHVDYDRRGQQVSTLDALHYRTTLAYDAWGNLTERVEFAQAAPDGAVFPSPDDRITRTSWDAANRKTSETRVNVEYSDPAAPTVTLRGDLVTTYGYDAVGNLTRVTDAAGASTYSYYDALGRTTAVAAPARASTSNGATVIPLTEFRRDAFGQVLAQVDRAAGAQRADEAGYLPATAAANITGSRADRLTLMQYDSHGHLVQGTDALGVSHYRSYDAHGRLAKTWQAVTTDDDGHRATLWQTWRRDALGREVEQRASQNVGDAVAHGTAWNAFGEVVARGIDGGWQELLDYDQAGRLWRSNAGDGQVKVMLHDLQGNTTALIQGNGHAPLPADSAHAAALATDVRRTDIRYDLLGRAVAQTSPEQEAGFFVADASTLRWPQPRTGVGQTLVIRHASGVTWTTLAIVDAGNGESGVDIAALAAGDYTFELRQAGFDGSTVTLPGMLHIAAGKAGEVPSTDGVPVIDNLTVRASTTGAKPGGKDAAAWLVWGNAGEGGTQRFEYRTAGSSEPWRSLPALSRGNGYFGVDRSAVPAGQYEYRLQLIPAGATEPNRTLTGEVALAAYAPLHIAATDPVDMPATVLQWSMPPAGATAFLLVRAVGSADWAEMAISTEVMGVDAEGQPVGVQKAVLDAYPVGAWEYDLSFARDGVLVGHASGQIDVPDNGGLPFLTNNTVAGTAYTLPASSRIASVTSTLTLRPTVHRTYDRWGNVVSVDDPRSPDWQTVIRYNAANQVVEQTHPDAGQGAPVTRYFFDRLARQIGMTDANGNITVNDYDAAGQLVAERHADGGIVRHFYDAFGDEVRTVDANGHAGHHQHDQLGRRIATISAPVDVFGFDAGGALADAGRQSIVQLTGYDEAGRITAQSDGLGNTTRTRYDLQGNVVAVIAPLGQQTRYAYDHHNRQSGMTDANGAHARWQYDHFGRLLAHTDIGGAATRVVCDSAGQMVSQTTQTGQDLRYTYDPAGKLVQIVDAANRKTTTYRYDAAGNRVTERTVQDGLLLQDNTLHFDSLGRMTDVTDRADGLAAVRIRYDRLGNRVHITTDIHGAGVAQHQEGWYAYDAMNRQVLVDAANAAGELGAAGHRVTYDLAGNRITDTWLRNGTETSAIYEYDALHRLVRTLRDGQYVEQRLYDAGSRLVYQAAMVDAGLPEIGEDGFFTGNAGQTAEDRIKAYNDGVPQADQLPENQRTYRYDANSRLLSQRVNDLFGNPDYLVDYGGTDSYDAVGNLLNYRVVKYGDDGYTNTFTNHLVRYEGYVIDRTDGRSTLYEDGSTSRQYDPYGNLVAITDAQGADNNRRYYNDATGQALLVQHGDKVQRQLIANGQVLGRYGTGPDPVKPRDDDANPQFATSADLNFTYQRVNDTHPGATPTAYRVQPGDTLQGIAQQAYGDAGYWYRIAEANGLDAKTALQTGQHLQLPGLPGTTFDRAESMRPYDASQVIGDTTPTMPPPPEDDGGCGVLGMIFVIIVAVVATVITAGAAAAAMGATATAAGGTGLAALGSAALTGGALVGAGGAALGAAVGLGAAVVGGIAGSILSQGVGMALGMQDSFSWSNVALGALSAGVTAGLGAVAPGILAGQGTLAVTSRAIVANAVTQGIGVATGLQEKFSWTSVAAAGIGSGVGQLTGHALQNTAFENVFGRYGVALASGFAGGAAAAVARGGRISVAQIAADAFGNAIGSSIAEANWSGDLSDTVREDFRRSEIEAMNNDARLADALAMSGPGMSEADYWNAPARTMADRYADTYGGQAMNTADRLRLNISSSNGIDSSQLPSAEYGFVQDYMSRNPNASVDDVRAAYDQAWADQSDAHLLQQARESLMQDSASLRMVGQSADGGLIWNTGAVSYPVGSPEIEVRLLQDGALGGTGLKQPISTWQDDFIRGYGGEYRSVMEGPAPASETIGRYSGEVVDSFKNFGMGMIGASSMNAAQASWSAGNYGISLLQGAQAFGEAGMTVFGFGLGSTARYGATMTAEELAAVRGTYANGAETVWLDSSIIRQSQKSISYAKTGGYTLDDIARGFVENPADPRLSIDAVRMRDGLLTSVDNSRPAVLNATGGKQIQTRIRAFDELLTDKETFRFTVRVDNVERVPTTWGDAVEARIWKQGDQFMTYYPNGSLLVPKVTGAPVGSIWSQYNQYPWKR
nr:LysM peptidoglycan-binding domain-containing protein [uncultured Noviherbaspirillum sp.]